MSGIEEAYAKYAKGLIEHKLNLALDRLDEQGAIIATLRQMILNLQVKVNDHDKIIEDYTEAIDRKERKIKEDEDVEKQCEQALDAEFIKQQLYENYQLLERIDKYIRL